MIGGPVQPRSSISAVASYSRQRARAAPRYPLKAFRPQGQRIGDAIGANADTDLYWRGFLSAMVSAPWPPIECPKMPTRFGSTGNVAATSAASSCVMYEYIR